LLLLVLKGGEGGREGGGDEGLVSCSDVFAREGGREGGRQGRHTWLLMMQGLAHKRMGTVAKARRRRKT
jgi:hypothetical protein